MKPAKTHSAKTGEQTQNRIRLDKWLWAARFYKTRTIARQAIDGGKVQCDGARAKPGKDVMTGMEISLRQGFDEKTVIVTALSEQRRSAAEAQTLYRETQESLDKRLLESERRRMQPSLLLDGGKPDKRDRRLIHQFKGRS
ncbi:MAG: S4 domain-containing protein [Pseudohongiellaceae bacterium]